MLTTATRDYLIAALAGLGVYSAAGLTSKVAPSGARQYILAPLIFAYTILAFFMSAQDTAAGPEGLSGWQLAMHFIHTNVWMVLTVASGLFAAHILASRVWRRWCTVALKDPCSATGLMAQEVCPNSQGPGFVGCVQQEAVAVTKAATTDLKYAMDLGLDALGGIGDAMSAAQSEFAQIRQGLEAAFASMSTRVLGAMLPAVRSGLSMKAMMGQMQAVMATMAYLLLAGLMSAKAFIGGFIQVSNTTVDILAATLAVFVAIMFFAPWMAIPAAVVGGTLAAVAIPLGVVTDMAKGLGISW